MSPNICFATSFQNTAQQGRFFECPPRMQRLAFATPQTKVKGQTGFPSGLWDSALFFTPRWAVLVAPPLRQLRVRWSESITSLRTNRRQNRITGISGSNTSSARRTSSSHSNATTMLQSQPSKVIHTGSFLFKVSPLLLPLLFTVLLCGRFLPTSHEDNFIPPTKFSSYPLRGYPHASGC